MAGDLEAVAVGGLVDPGLDLLGGQLLDLVARLADEVMVVKVAAAPESLLAVAREHIEQTRLGE